MKLLRNPFVKAALWALTIVFGVTFLLTGSGGEYVLASTILQAAASTTTTNQINFIPQFIYFVASTVPTSLKLTTLQGGVIMDLDSDGCTAMNLLSQYGTNTNAYLYQLGNGKVEGVQAEITMNNAVAAQVDVKEWSENMGFAFMQYLKTTVLDGTPTVFSDFAYWAGASLGANDTLSLDFYNQVEETGKGAVVQNILSRDEVAGRVQYFQNNAGVYVVHNLEQTVRRVQLIPSGANRSCYTASYILAERV